MRILSTEYTENMIANSQHRGEEAPGKLSLWAIMQALPDSTTATTMIEEDLTDSIVHGELVLTIPLEFCGYLKGIENW